jgi:D-aminoacyl-tRNA deacylase
MKIVLQRVSRASVSVDGDVVGQIGKGLLLLLGIHGSDTATEAQLLARKCVELRIFDDPQGKMNLGLAEVNGEVLVVSQFTLYGDCRKGRRPSYSDAAPPEVANTLYETFLLEMGKLCPRVAAGRFGAHMLVELVNDGPVTLLLEIQREAKSIEG